MNEITYTFSMHGGKVWTGQTAEGHATTTASVTIPEHTHWQVVMLEFAAFLDGSGYSGVREEVESALGS